MKFFNAPMTHRRAIWPRFVIATTVIIGGAPWLPVPYNVDKLGLPAVGGLWALAFYLHSRHSEDARFAKELLTDFNERYDEQNAGLQRAILTDGPFDQEVKLKFIDYFNLCAEEWLFCKLGYNRACSNIPVTSG